MSFSKEEWDERKKIADSFLSPIDSFRREMNAMCPVSAFDNWYAKMRKIMKSASDAKGDK